MRFRELVQELLQFFHVSPWTRTGLVQPDAELQRADAVCTRYRGGRVIGFHVGRDVAPAGGRSTEKFENSARRIASAT
jgi:hypothetical protein